MTRPAAALAALAAGSATARQDADGTQSVRDLDEQDVGQGDSGDAIDPAEDNDVAAPGSEQQTEAEGAAGDAAAERNQPGRAAEQRADIAPAATASDRPAVETPSGRLSPDNPFPPVVLPPLSPPPLTPTPREPPPDLPGYTVSKLHGSGGFADVYLYEQHLSRRSVAVKVVIPGVADRVLLAQQADAGVFSPEPVEPAAADRYWAEMEKALACMQHTQSGWRRPRSRLSLASLRGAGWRAGR